AFAAGDFDSTPTSVEIGRALTIFRSDVAAAGLAVNVTMNLPKGQIASAGVDFNLAGDTSGGNVAPRSSETEVKIDWHLDRIMTLRTSMSHHPPKLFAE